MKLSTVINKYIDFKRGLGMHMRSEAALLQKFSRAMGKIDIADVNPEAVRTFIVGKGPITASCKQTASVLRSFYRYANSRGFAATSPGPTRLPKIPSPRPPYIYTRDELKRLLAATAVLQTKRSPWRARAYRTFLLLLYGTGLRLGEALSLTLRDVDLSAAIITVRSGKFFKRRIVPIGPKLTRELSDYAKLRRHRQPLPTGDGSMG
jgi:integrase/recombinase XerD